MPDVAVNARAVSSSASRRLPAACSSTVSACAGADIMRAISATAWRSHMDTRRSRARLGRIGEEELLSVDLVVGDRLLAFRGHQPVDEGLAEVLFHMRMLGRVHQDHAVLVEQPSIALDRDRKL